MSMPEPRGQARRTATARWPGAKPPVLNTGPAGFRAAQREPHPDWFNAPVPSFGPASAELVIVGLAPGLRGANRTGRMFPGDRSGEFLYRALCETGFANHPQSTSRDDGLLLKDAYITAPVRCVPPENKPPRQEILSCRAYLIREIALLKNVRLVVVLGGIALDAYLSALQDQHVLKSRGAFRFRHGTCFETHPHGPLLLASYHPSQQNTSTQRLTAAMLREIFEQAQQLLDHPKLPEAVEADSSAAAGK